MRRCGFVLRLSLFSLILGVCVAAAQQPRSLGPGLPSEVPSTRNGATVKVNITGEDKKPLKHESLIRLTRMENGKVEFQSTRNSHAEFPNMTPGKYLLEVGAAGYIALHEQFALPDLQQDFTENVELHKDPTAVDLTAKDAGQLSPKTRKNVDRGIQALELGNLQEAHKYLDNALKQDPGSSRIQFLVAYLAYQQKDPDRAIAGLRTAVKLDPKNLQAQNLLGKISYDRDDYAHALESEEAVIASNPDSVPARRIVANSALKLKQWEKARESAQWLVDRGGAEGTAAKLILGQALAGLHKDKEAIPVLQAFLEAEPSSAVAPHVRDLVEVLEKRLKDGVSGPEFDGVTEGSALGEEGGFGSAAGMPVDIDAHPPIVAANVQCPANLLDMATQRSKELVDDVAKFSAIEDMVHERLGDNGLPRTRESRKFNYLVSITEPPKGALIIQEFRDAAGGVLDMPEQIVTSGLPVLAVTFHPAFRDGFDMKCEGLGDFNGQAAWLVHFRQRDDKPVMIRTYVVNGNNYPIRLKGRAWISVDSYQVLHLETDLIKPIPEIKLLTEHTTVNYGPVEFKKFNTDLWLPKTADLYVHFSKHRFHRSESFDHFMLWATDAQDKIKAPPNPPEHASGPNQN